MKKGILLLLVLCLFTAGWAFAADKPDSYAEGYALFSGITDAIGNAYTQAAGNHSEGLEYDDPANIDAVLFMPFLSIDMAFTNMLDESVADHVVQTVFSVFGMEDVAFTRQAPHDYLITYTKQEGERVEIHCEFSPENGAIRYSRRDDGVTMDFQELAPLGENRYALQNGSQRAVVTYADGKAEAFVYSSAGQQSLFGSGEMVYDLENDGIYPSASGVDEAWVTEREDLRQTVRLDATALSVKGCDLFGLEKDAVIPR